MSAVVTLRAVIGASYPNTPTHTAAFRAALPAGRISAGALSLETTISATCAIAPGRSVGTQRHSRTARRIHCATSTRAGTITKRNGRASPMTISRWNIWENLVMPNALFDDGWHAGPLFVPQKKRPARVRKSGGAEVWAKYSRATPPWADRKAIADKWRDSMRLTAATGVQHSVDHIVPLSHPLVCGLHVAANLRVIPLADNLAKGARYWPGMWGEQIELF